MQPRNIESYIHIETLHDLIVANWLTVNGQVRPTEDVTHVFISTPNDKGVCSIRFTIEPAVQTIY